MPLTRAEKLDFLVPRLPAAPLASSLGRFEFLPLSIRQSLTLPLPLPLPPTDGADGGDSLLESFARSRVRPRLTEMAPAA